LKSAFFMKLIVLLLIYNRNNKKNKKSFGYNQNFSYFDRIIRSQPVKKNELPIEKIQTCFLLILRFKSKPSSFSKFLHHARNLKSTVQS